MYYRIQEHLPGFTDVAIMAESESVIQWFLFVIEGVEGGGGQ